MNRMIRNSLPLLMASAMLATRVAASEAPTPPGPPAPPVASAAPHAPVPLSLPDFDSLARKAAETVRISLDTTTLGIAASFLDPSDPEDAAARELIKGLKGIYVRNFTFDEDLDDAMLESQINALRMQLKAPGWQQLLSVHSNREQTSSEIYLLVDQGRTTGLAIIDSEPREFTVVNIVGEIDLEKMRRLEGRFGIPKLQLEQKLQ
jgi:hypothetical protein